MRILHTSDWHLGRTFLGESMHEHQAMFLDWLVDQVAERDIEAVLVSGDIYDRSVPPPSSVALLSDALQRLSARCPVVLTSGNHDSPTRLNFGGAFFERGGVHLRCSLADIDRPVLLTGADGVQVAIYGLPYLEPDHHRAALGAERSHAAVLTAAMDRVRADAAARDDARVIVMAHAFITGGQGSESERDVRVGGIGDAPASVFAGVEYAALGHLHGAQQIASADPHVRYSGSPLAYSFSEQGHTKSVTVLDITDARDIAVELVPVPVPRPISTLQGSLVELLCDESFAEHEDHWVRAILTDERRQPDAMAQLRTRFPYALQLDYIRTVSHQRAALVDVQSTPAIDVATQFIEEVTATPVTDDERALLDAAIEQVRIRGVAQ